MDSWFTVLRVVILQIILINHVYRNQPEKNNTIVGFVIMIINVTFTVQNKQSVHIVTYVLNTALKAVPGVTVSTINSGCGGGAKVGYKEGHVSQDMYKHSMLEIDDISRLETI